MTDFSDFLRLIAAIIGAALAMLAWSEFVFFNEGVAQGLRAEFANGLWPGLRFVLMFGAFYCVASGFLIGLMGFFGSLGMPRLMILGALTGFAIEGAVVNAVYEAVPFSYLWTSVAWHGPITVALGAFLVPRLLSGPSVPVVALWAALIGATWGFWTTWTWGDDGSPSLTAFEFAVYVGQTMAIMAIGTGLLFFAGWPRIVLSRPLSIALMVPACVLFVIQGLAVPVAAAGLAVIMAALVLLLRWFGASPSPANALRPASLVFWILTPVAAIATYWSLTQVGPLIPPEDVVLLIAGSGFVVWGVGVVAGLFRASKPAR